MPVPADYQRSICSNCRSRGQHGMVVWRSHDSWKMALGVCAGCKTIFVRTDGPGVHMVPASLVNSLYRTVAGEESEADPAARVGRAKLVAHSPAGGLVDALDVRLALWIGEAELEEDDNDGRDQGSERDPGAGDRGRSGIDA